MVLFGGAWLRWWIPLPVRPKEHARWSWKGVFLGFARIWAQIQSILVNLKWITLPVTVCCGRCLVRVRVDYEFGGGGACSQGQANLREAPLVPLGRGPLCPVSLFLPPSSLSLDPGEALPLTWVVKSI